MDSRRHYRNQHVRAWLKALHRSRGELSIAAHQQSAAGLYHLGALWAEERGYIKKDGPVEPIGHVPRRFRYIMTDKGKRITKTLFGHAYRYDHFRAGMLCDRCGNFVSDFL